MSDYAGSTECIRPAEQIESGTAKNRPCDTGPAFSTNQLSSELIGQLDNLYSA